jgi:serine/threonine protein phosphatase PrpC
LAPGPTDPERGPFQRSDRHRERANKGTAQIGLLLCSDGLSGPVGDEQIAELLGLHRDPEDACRALIDAALDHGGRDNVTVVLADYTIRSR